MYSPKGVNTMKHTIEISKGNNTWVIKQGTDTIKTSYSIHTYAEVVQRAIQKLNLDCVVIVSNKIDKASFL